MFYNKNTPIKGMEPNCSKVFTLSGKKRKQALTVCFGDYNLRVISKPLQHNV